MPLLPVWMLNIQLVFAQPVAEMVIHDFEGASLGGWKAEGDAFGKGPSSGALPGQMGVSGFLGKGLANSFHGGDKTTGTLTSPVFTLKGNTLSFLMGGGRSEDVGAELLVEGRRVRLVSGEESEELRWMSWDVRELKGQHQNLHQSLLQSLQ